MSDELVQLDLTLSVTEVPQANSLPLFIRLVDAIHRGTDGIEALADELEVDQRTVHYYVDFGRWLHLLRNPARGTVDFTETGQSFADSIPARGRLFAGAMFGRKLVKTVQALKRDSRDEDDLETLGTREACFRAILGLTDLSETTAKRRASGLAHMLEAAYKPSQIDWATGKPKAEHKPRLEWEGRSFLTALGARQFGVSREFRIGFPRQVRAFVEDHGHGMSASVWRRASYKSRDGKAVWFGAIPVNESTVEVARRGGRDLRRFLMMVAPYLSIAVAVLTFRDPLGRPTVRLTHDMYGLRFWEHERELGEPLAVIEQIADAMELVVTRGIPTELTEATPELVEFGSGADLVETLIAAGFVREKDTTFELAPGVDGELRDARDDAASVVDLVKPVYDAFRGVLRSNGVE
jgi:hypothetical protein